MPGGDEDEDDCGVDYRDGQGGGDEKKGEPAGGETLVGRGFGLPSGAGRVEEAAVVRRTMALLASQLRAREASAYLPVLAIDEPSPTVRQASAQASSASGPSKLSGPRVARGPAMPSREALAVAKAQVAAAGGPLLLEAEVAASLRSLPALPPALVARGRLGGDDSDDGDEGPVLPGAKGDWSLEAGQAEDDEAEAAAKRRRMDSEWALVREKGLSATDAAAQVRGRQQGYLDLEHGGWRRKRYERESTFLKICPQIKAQAASLQILCLLWSARVCACALTPALFNFLFFFGRWRQTKRAWRRAAVSRGCSTRPRTAAGASWTS
jgi:hypothetical protein